MAWPGCACSPRKKRKTWRTAMPRSNRKRGLIDDAGALADQALPYPAAAPSLQIKLIRGLRRCRLHLVGRCTASAIASGIAEVILLSLGIGTNIVRLDLSLVSLYQKD